jgi:single-stranded-DNA-specific exonuclease
MEPFGPDNLRPVFITRNVCDKGYSKIVKEKHIRFVLRDGDIAYTGIGYNIAEKFHLLSASAPVDLVYTIDENDYNGQKSLQLKVIDFRAAEG